MTMIVNLPTKKALKEAVAAGARIVVTDPAAMPEWQKYGSHFTLDMLPLNSVIAVTNHPKRSWFAEVKKLGNGVIKVS